MFLLLFVGGRGIEAEGEEGEGGGRGGKVGVELSVVFGFGFCLGAFVSFGT